MRANVTMGAVRFELVDTSDANVRVFVETAHRLAKETHATLHSFVRNTLWVSWGTTSFKARPEMSALRFFAGLGKLAAPSASETSASPWVPVDDKASKFPAVRVSGALCSGSANCRLAGGAQKALVIETPPWAEVLDKLLRFAAKRQTLVCPAAMAADVLEVATRTIAAVSVPPEAADSVAHLKPVVDSGRAPYVKVNEVLAEVARRKRRIRRTRP